MRRPRGSLNEDVILQAARELLGQQGMDGLSARKIAGRLNAGTMSIYHYFPDRKSLAAALVDDFVQRAHSIAHDTSDWRSWLEATFLDIYEATIREPEYLQLMTQSRFIGEASLKVMTEVTSLLQQAGMTLENAARTFYQLLSFTLGAALLSTSLNDESSLQEQEDRQDKKGSKSSGHKKLEKPVHSQQTGDFMDIMHPIMQGKTFADSLHQLVDSINHP